MTTMQRTTQRLGTYGIGEPLVCGQCVNMYQHPTTSTTTIKPIKAESLFIVRVYDGVESAQMSSSSGGAS